MNSRTRQALLISPKFTASSISMTIFKNMCEILGARYPTPPLGLLTMAALLPSSWGNSFDRSKCPGSDACGYRAS